MIPAPANPSGDTHFVLLLSLPCVATNYDNLRLRTFAVVSPRIPPETQKVLVSSIHVPWHTLFVLHLPLLTRMFTRIYDNLHFQIFQTSKVDLWTTEATPKDPQLSSKTVKYHPFCSLYFICYMNPLRGLFDSFDTSLCLNLLILKVCLKIPKVISENPRF